jgi:hypothetical protein
VERRVHVEVAESNAIDLHRAAVASEDRIEVCGGSQASCRTASWEVRSRCYHVAGSVPLCRGYCTARKERSARYRRRVRWGIKGGTPMTQATVERSLPVDCPSCIFDTTPFVTTLLSRDSRDAGQKQSSWQRRTVPRSRAPACIRVRNDPDIAAGSQPRSSKLFSRMVNDDLARF